MPRSTDLKFFRSFDAVINRLRKAAKDAPELVQEALRVAAEKAQEVLTERTPRSTGEDPGETNDDHLADHWEVDLNALGEFTREGAYQVRVYNSDPRATEPLRLANGSQTPYTLLHILEYGSDPHPITPVNSSHLVFWWKEANKGEGGIVRMLKVENHPGTKPYGMLTFARLAARQVLQTRLDLIRLKLTRR